MYKCTYSYITHQFKNKSMLNIFVPNLVYMKDHRHFDIKESYTVILRKELHTHVHFCDMYTLMWFQIENYKISTNTHSANYLQIENSVINAKIFF